MPKRQPPPPARRPASRWALFAIALAVAAVVAIAATLTRTPPDPGTAPQASTPPAGFSGATGSTSTPNPAASAPPGAPEVEQFGNLQFEIPAGWAKYADVSALVYVPPGEQPPQLPYGGIKSAGIVVGEPMRFGKHNVSLEEEWGKVLDEDPTLIKRGAFRRVSVAQPGVEALAVEVQKRQDSGVYFLHSVWYLVPGSLTQVEFGAVDETRYRRYAPAFQHFVETVRIR